MEIEQPISFLQISNKTWNEASLTEQVAAEAVRNMFQERLAGFEGYVTKGTLPVSAERILRATKSPEASASFKPASSTPTATVSISPLGTLD